jgi:hypothetical protein
MIRRLLVATTLALALVGGASIATSPAASSTPTSTASVALASVSTITPAPVAKHCPRYGCRPSFHPRRPFFFAHRFHPRFYPRFHHPRFHFYRHRGW